MSALAKTQSTEVSTVAEGATLLAVISRAASDPNTDVTKMERLMAMYERVEAKRAESEFNAAMTKTQADITRVATDKTNTQTHSDYATYAQLDRAVRPIYTANGFALSFGTEPAKTENMITVVCHVSHEAGHSCDYRIDMPADGKGAKGGDVMTKTHAVGSGATYGMRYLLKMIFNIAIGSDPDDDDGNGANEDSSVADPIYDKIDISESLDELRKLRPEIESAKVAQGTRRNIIAHYNAKAKKLKGEPK